MNGPGRISSSLDHIRELENRILETINGVECPPGLVRDRIDAVDSRKVIDRLVDFPHKITMEYIGQLQEALRTESVLSEEDVAKAIVHSVMALHNQRGTFIPEVFEYCSANTDGEEKKTVQWNRFIASQFHDSVKHTFDDSPSEVTARAAFLREMQSVFNGGNEELIYDLDFRILRNATVTTAQECDVVTRWLEESGLKNARLRMAFRYASYDPIVTYQHYVAAVSELTSDEIAEDIKNHIRETVVDASSCNFVAEFLAMYLKDRAISLDRRKAVAVMFAETFAPLQKITNAERFTLRDAPYSCAVKMDPEIFYAFFVERFISLYGVNSQGSGSQKIPLAEEEINSVIVLSLRDHYLAEMVEGSVITGAEALHVVSLKMEEIMALEGSESTVIYSANITDGLKAIARALDPGLDAAQHHNRIPLELHGWVTYRS